MLPYSKLFRTQTLLCWHFPYVSNMSVHCLNNLKPFFYVLYAVQETDTLLPKTVHWRVVKIKTELLLHPVYRWPTRCPNCNHYIRKQAGTIWSRQELTNIDTIQDRICSEGYIRIINGWIFKYKYTGWKRN